MDYLSSSVSRRHFIHGLTTAALVSAIPASLRAQVASAQKIKLGYDNFAIRSFGWKAPQLLDYAAEQKVDTLFITDLEAYENLEDGYLREIRAKADQLRVEIYTGSWSICPTSVR